MSQTKIRRQSDTQKCTLDGSLRPVAVVKPTNKQNEDNILDKAYENTMSTNESGDESLMSLGSENDPQKMNPKKGRGKVKKCKLCSKHNEIVTTMDNHKPCKIYEEVIAGKHWCDICIEVFQRRREMKLKARETRDKRKKMEGLQEGETWPHPTPDNDFISQKLCAISSQTKRMKTNDQHEAKIGIEAVPHSGHLPSKTNATVVTAASPSAPTTSFRDETPAQIKKPLTSSLKSEPSTKVLNEMSREQIFIKSWEMLMDPYYYEVISRMTLWKWVFLVIKMNNGDIDAAINMITNSKKESTESLLVNCNLNKLTIGEKLVEPSSLASQLNAFLPTARPTGESESIFHNSYLPGANAYKEGLIRDTLLPYSLFPLQLNAYYPYYTGPNEYRFNLG